MRCELGCATKAPPEPFPSATPEAVVAVTGRLFPAVVRIDVAAETYRDGKRGNRQPDSVKWNSLGYLYNAVVDHQVVVTK